MFSTILGGPLENLIHSNDVKYVIVQAGGKGSRMNRYTTNKPKCLVPVNGITMIENTFRVFNNCKVIVIGDHLYETLDRYLTAFCRSYDYVLIRTNQQGTAAGIDAAIALIPPDQPFALTWSDLFFESAPEYSFGTDILIGLTDQFECRWCYEDQQFKNVSSKKNGVAGFYVFKNTDQLQQISTEQSLVRGFLSSVDSSKISTFSLAHCFEVGQSAQYEQLIQTNRFFNQVDIEESKVVKTCKVEQYQHLIQDEIAWYQYVDRYNINVPKLISVDPLTIQRIVGSHAFTVTHNKNQVINNYCYQLHQLHSLEQISVNFKDCDQVYKIKPMQRMQKVAQVIPHADVKEFKINGIWCKNPLHNWEHDVFYPAHFSLIHGDPTFSNTLVDEYSNIWFIDPRGRFGDTALYGDPAYDWAKFYYSAVGNYDSVNHKQFEVKLNGNSVELEIASLGFEQFGDQILEESGLSHQHMNYLHAGIWLSLSGYVIEDLDAIMFAFYQGVYLWNQL